MRTPVCLTILLSVAATGCGYNPARKIFFGGISSGGDKPDDSDGRAKDGTPSSKADDTHQNGETGTMPSAGLSCGKAANLVGTHFIAAAGNKAVPESCSSEAATSDVACVASIGFVSDHQVELRFVDGVPGGSAYFATVRYDQCDVRVQLTFEKTRGVTEQHELALSVDAQTLLDVGSQRLFLREAP